MRPQQHQITVQDGANLAATLFEPDRTPSKAIILHGATGVPQSYYAKFATWLAAREAACVATYDYRDTAASATGHMRASPATMTNWGVDDQSAALDWLHARQPGVPLWVIGHSLGGMFLTSHPGANQIERAVIVAAGPAFWTDHPLTLMPQIVAFWWLIGPLATALFGYLPGRLLGLGADLPGGVYWQWRRWCLSRDFYRIDIGSALPEPVPTRLTCPLRIVGIEDDPMIPPRVAASIAQFYSHAQIEQRVISPRDVGSTAIGHLSVFAERNQACWPRLLD